MRVANMQNQNNVIPLPTAEVRQCACCGESAARCGFQDEHFLYGTGDQQVSLIARVPVWTCDLCGAQYTDADAEELRHAEVCRYLGRLSPAELRGIRNRYSLSQEQWAERTGFGLASIKRWEVGALIQGAAADRYLRLLTNPEIFAKVTQMSGRPAGSDGRFHFQTELPKAAFQHAPLFVLRKTVGNI